MSRIGAKKQAERRALATPVAEPEERAKLTETFAPAPRISTWGNQGSWGDLSWPQIEAILRNAERGYVDQWADFCRRMLKSDDHLLSVYTTYIGAIAGARREVTPAQVLPHQEEIAKLQAADCEALLESLPNIERTFAELLDADFTGYAAQEIIWEPQGDWIKPTQLDWLNPNRFRFSDDYTLYLYDRGQAAQRAKELGIEADPSKGIMGMPLVANKYLVHIPRLLPDYATSSGLLLACVRPWYVKSWATRFWLSGAEAAGNPRLLGVLAENAPAAIREELYQALANMSADSVGVVSGGTSIEILDVKSQGEGSVWDKLVKNQNAALSKAVLGSTLNVEVGDTGGNRSLGESQADMTMSPRWARSSSLLANTIETYLFRPFLELNAVRYGGQVFVPKLSLHIVEDEPMVDQIVLDAGVVTVDELRRSRKLEPLGPEKGGDRLIPRPAAPAAFSASGGEPSAVPLAQMTAASMRALNTQTMTGTQTSTRLTASRSHLQTARSGPLRP